MRQNQFRHFKIGDIIVCKSIWGDKKFIVDKMYGNIWCPILDSHEFGKERSVNTICLFNPNLCKLVNAKRPLARLNKVLLIKLYKKGNLEAKREFEMRVYNKQLK